jgi:hypothetical protein
MHKALLYALPGAFRFIRRRRQEQTFKDCTVYRNGKFCRSSPEFRRPQRIGPPLLKLPREGGADFRREQRVVEPALGV